MDNSYTKLANMMRGQDPADGLQIGTGRVLSVLPLRVEVFGIVFDKAALRVNDALTGRWTQTEAAKITGHEDVPEGAVSLVGSTLQATVQVEAQLLSAGDAVMCIAGGDVVYVICKVV